MTPWLALALAALLALLPAAQAGTPQAPELADPAGDVVVDRTAAPLPARWADAIDLDKVWFADDAAGLHATLHLKDLSAVAGTDAGVMADTFWVVLWSPAYQHPGAVANRTGTWELRAEYRPMDTTKWHFWMERPCKDGNDFDGCSGDDRDILDGLAGEVDVTASTLRLTAPWHDLGDPQPGDAIHGLWATAQMVWPSYPAYSVDWDTDQGQTCYAFTALPADDNGTDAGPTGGSDGRTALPQDYGPFPRCPSQAGAPTAGATSATPSPTPAPATNGTASMTPTATSTKRATALPALVPLGVLAAALLRRKGS